MRTLYTILFFIDTIALTCLSYLFLQKLDNGSKEWVLFLIFSGIVASIFLLLFLLMNYIKATWTATLQINIFFAPDQLSADSFCPFNDSQIIFLVARDSFAPTSKFLENESAQSSQTL
jgi:RsiW-degrading membrane proteinase PrsW (M82 family)